MEQYMSPDEIEAAIRNPMHSGAADVVAYVMDKAERWETFIESNYRDKWDEFYRIWRGYWAEEDKTRDSERSRIVTPATQQAVESSVCEVEEATFGTGKLFDLNDDYRDEQKGDVEMMKRLLCEAFKTNRIRSSTAEAILNAAVTGTGIGEIVLEGATKTSIATQPIMDGTLEALGTTETESVNVKLRPIQCKNFYIDPVATSIEDAHGCCIDEFVPLHSVEKLQREGVYRDVWVGTAAPDQDIDPDQELPVYNLDDRVRLLKYYGLVPRYLLTMANWDSDEELPEDIYDDDEPVEAIVVIANKGTLLKAEESPYMMKDRPVVAFQWDIVPGLFYGRGVVEKGYNSQKALDAEIRARIDALSLTIHPAMAIDATKIPRGHKPVIRAGKNIYTNGNPKDVLNPLKLGEVSQITFAQAAELQKMVQQSTGAVDASGLPGTVNGEATAAGVSMSLGAIIKRQKRTLLNFQENFWIPFVQKAAWRYMQFDPENWPIQDFKFIPSSSLGIMAREYEVTQLVQLLQTTSDQSPMYGALVESIVDNMNIENREQLKEILRQASQPNPEEVQRQQQMHQMEMALKQGQVDYVAAQARESDARATNYMAEAQAVPEELQIKKLDAITKNLQPGAEDDGEFARRLKTAEIALKERELNIKEAEAKTKAKNMDAQVAARKELSQFSKGS